MSDDARQAQISHMIKSLQERLADPLLEPAEQQQEAQQFWAKYCSKFSPAEQQHIIAQVNAPQPIASVVFGDDSTVIQPNIAVANQGDTTQQQGTNNASSSAGDVLQTVGSASVGDAGRVHGAVIGVNDGTISMFFGAQPPANAKALLDSYLESLITHHDVLQVSRLLTKPLDGRGTAIKPLTLCDVFTSLAVDAAVREPFRLSAEQIAELALSPDAVPPEQVRLPVDAHGHTLELERRRSRAETDNQPADLINAYWQRPLLALEALAQDQHVVLLGAPGSGKSTALSYLIVQLALALLNPPSAATQPQPHTCALLGWDTLEQLPIPCFCRLSTVVGMFTADTRQDVQVLINTLLEPIIAAELRDELKPKVLDAWRSGGAMLLLDGLDEVSAVVDPATQRSPRQRIVTAISQLQTQLGRVRMIITCRTHAYNDQRPWELAEWQVRTIQSLAFGQVRTFLRAWYPQVSAKAEGYAPAVALERADQLIERLERARRREAHDPLAQIIGSPLLLTMLALLHYNSTEFPTSRAAIYHALVDLLLDRWSNLRADGGLNTREQPRQRVSLAERLNTLANVADWPLPVDMQTAALLPALYALGFQAHGLPSADAGSGSGILHETVLYDIFDAFFARLLCPKDPEQVKRKHSSAYTDAFITVLSDETGLIHPYGKDESGNDTYIVPHLTFQEYLAAAYLAYGEEDETAFELWRAEPERWREVLLLLMGCCIRENKWRMIQRWLKDTLLSYTYADVDKPLELYQRDVLFAADCYAEVRHKADALGSKTWSLRTFEQQLSEALTTLLEQPAPAVARPERLRAAAYLAELGDTRYPVTPAEWQRETSQRSRAFTRAGSHYWRYVPGGSYTIGGWEKDQPSVDVELPEFWVARFPLTVAQYAPFVAVGYAPDAELWWCKKGLEWKRERRRQQPWRWNSADYAQLNQPVIGVSWYEAAAYCTWLTEQLKDVLPADYCLRLPTEAEWEVLAAWEHGQRHTYPWGEPEPTPELAVYEDDDGRDLGHPAAVGVCPAGAAACGALDVAGNVWEWTASADAEYPQQCAIIEADPPTHRDMALRGGSYWNNRTYVRCAARGWGSPGVSFGSARGFRCVLAPRSLICSKS